MKEIDDLIGTINASIMAEITDSEGRAAAVAALGLLRILLRDIGRIADVAEVLASPEKKS